MAQAIGQVIFISGKAKAVDSAGNERDLDINSMVFLGETIITEGVDSSILLKMDNNQTITMGRNDRLTLDSDIYDPNSLPSEEGITSVEDIQQALSNDPNFDPSTLEATAAGGATVGDSTAEPVLITHTQQSVEFDFLETEGINNNTPTITTDAQENNVVLIPSANNAPVLTITQVNDFTEDSGSSVGDVVATYTTSDPDGDSVSVTLSDTTNYALDGSGNVILTQAGVDLVNAGTDLPAFTLTPNDGSVNGPAQTADPSVTPVNDAPELTITQVNDFIEDSGNSAGDVVATYTTSDPDGDTVSVTLSDTTNYALDGSGNVVLTNAGVALINAGTDLPAFTLTPNDGSVNGIAQTADPAVTPVNDAPELTITQVNDFIEDSGNSAGDIVATYTTSDEDGDTVSVTLSDTVNYALDGSGNVVLTNAGVALINAGTDLPAFTLTPNDGTVNGIAQTADPSVTPVNDAPVAVDSLITSNEDTSYIFNSSDFGFSDPDGDQLVDVRIDSLPADGTLQHFDGANWVAVSVNQVISVNEITDGNLRFIPDLNESGNNDYSGNGVGNQQADYAQLSFSAFDGNEWSASSATMTIDVNAIADAPALNILAETLVEQTIDSTNVTDTSSGFVVNAYAVDGSNSTISFNNNPPGFGVTGNASGANTELGYSDAAGTSETLSVKFDQEVSSVNVSFAWINSRETATWDFYNNGVLVGSDSLTGGSDRVDPAISIQPDNGAIFDEIIFSSPGHDDDYLIHSISYNQIEKTNGPFQVQEGNDITLDISASLVDTDGSESMDSIVINNIPSGTTLTDGVNSYTAPVNSVGSINVTDWSLNALSLTAPLVSQDTNYSLEVVATSLETSNGDTNSTTANIDLTVTNLNTATLMDAIVAGLEYTTTSGLQGLTQTDGSFQYLEGDTVTFKLGNVVIGEIAMNDIADQQVFLQDIADVSRTDVNNEYLENMAVLLQSLDVDNDAYNGIVITQSMRDAFSDDDFDLATITESDLRDIIESTGREAITEDAAMKHVQDVLVDNTELVHDDFDERVEDSNLENLIGEEDFQLNTSQFNEADAAETVAEENALSDDSLQISDVLIGDENLDPLLDFGPETGNGQEVTIEDTSTQSQTQTSEIEQPMSMDIELDTSLSDLLTELKPDDPADVV